MNKEGTKASTLALIGDQGANTVTALWHSLWLLVLGLTDINSHSHVHIFYKRQSKVQKIKQKLIMRSHHPATHGNSFFVFFC